MSLFIFFIHTFLISFLLHLHVTQELLIFGVHIRLCQEHFSDLYLAYSSFDHMGLLVKILEIIADVV